MLQIDASEAQPFGPASLAEGDVNSKDLARSFASIPPFIARLPTEQFSKLSVRTPRKAALFAKKKFILPTSALRGEIPETSVRSHRHIRHLGGALEPGIALEKRQVHISGRAVALLGDQQIHRDGLAVRRRLPVLVLLPFVRFVE